MLAQVKDSILKSLRQDPMGAQRVLNQMEAGKKINAIKELRELGRDVTSNGCAFGLKEAKDFVELYMSTSSANTDRNRFIKDITPKGKRAKQAINYQFDGVDIRQVDTKTLRNLFKAMRKELKKRGEQI